jgi:hypothetical protein
MPSRGLLWSIAAAIALTLAAPQAAQAQTKAEVGAARALFQSAVADEGAKRFEVALEKFRRVQAVKDTTNVRYRIAACLEALGKLRDAVTAYDAAIQLGETEAKSGDTVKAARERIVELKKRMPALTITLSEKAPSDAEVEIDNEKVASTAVGAPIFLDPGVHEVSGTAPETPPFHTSLTLAEGAHVSLVVRLERPPPLAKPPEVVPPVVIPSHHDVREPVPVVTDGSGRRTWGFIGLGTGGVLLVGSGVVLLLRHNDIATLNDACKGGVCPKSREGELTSVRSRAVTEGPVAAVFAGAGVVAAGLGAYLLLTADEPKPAAASTPVVSGFITGSSGGVDLTGRF